MFCRKISLSILNILRGAFKTTIIWQYSMTVPMYKIQEISDTTQLSVHYSSQSNVKIKLNDGVIVHNRWRCRLYYVTFAYYNILLLYFLLVCCFSFMKYRLTSSTGMSSVSKSSKSTLQKISLSFMYFCVSYYIYIIKIGVCNYYKYWNEYWNETFDKKKYSTFGFEIFKYISKALSWSFEIRHLQYWYIVPGTYII